MMAYLMSVRSVRIPVLMESLGWFTMELLVNLLVFAVVFINILMVVKGLVVFQFLSHPCAILIDGKCHM
ncbi:hypothetical protein BIT28_11780 [Photobacterium proteolyticum]|uniref:Uncharacterized protein n=1 Tax=Photobacterium proteolyticum TaxID=1903952 RepID=A0A1Q9GSD6_9GAMM|nr:hypothetical protein BIT28_11780 [Photobacterium proteolyticum]